MFGVQLRKKIVEQKDRFFPGRFFDEFDEDEFQSDEDGFILPPREVFIGWYIVEHDIPEIIEMRTDIRMSGNDIPFPILLQISSHARSYITKIDFCDIFEHERIPSVQKRFDGSDAILYEISKLFPV